MKRFPRPTHPLAPALLTAAAALIAGCAVVQEDSFEWVDDIDSLVSHGQYEEAVRVAAARCDERPDVPELVEAHRLATVAYLLEKGRRLTFEEDDDEALEAFRQALELEPDSEQTLGWYEKTRSKLAFIWYERAREYHVNDENLDAALEAYRRALAFKPDFDLARKGATQALIQLNYRAGLSVDYYNEGVRALHDYGLELAKSRFGYSSKYRPGDQRARRRSSEVEMLLARERMAIASNLEAQELFAAARNEYAISFLMDPENEDAAAGRERMKIEAEAEKLMESADMMILRGEFQRARDQLTKGLEMTNVQTGKFEDLLADIDDAKARAAYQTALDLEHDFRYEEAIAVYDKLLADREWFEDARSRMNTLEEYVQSAREFYTSAVGAETDEQKILLFRKIEVFWPEYMDVREQLDLLEGK